MGSSSSKLSGDEESSSKQSGDEEKLESGVTLAPELQGTFNIVSMCPLSTIDSPNVHITINLCHK